ncbi:Hypothetical protein FKW44_011089, partial [Caligus rogercresseyi]
DTTTTLEINTRTHWPKTEPGEAHLCLIPRLDNECKGSNAAQRAIQVAINDAARSIVGYKRRDHIH